MANILMVIAPEYFRDEEYFEPKQIFEASGHNVTTASTKVGKINGSHGGYTNAETILKDVNTNSYDTVVFVGGQGSYVLDENSDAHRIANEFHDQGKLINAICHAPIIIAKTGLLNNKSATVFSGDVDELTSLGVKYANKGVVKDGHFITANGPKAATEFANLILTSLN